MSVKLSIGVDWQGNIDREKTLARVRVADEVGVDSAWVAEAWGRDCFTLLTLMADRTRRIRLGTGIVNAYSRTPAALAQHFATLDELSEGRMIAGFGTSGQSVIEHFHGVPFQPALTRLRETIEIFDTLMRHEPLHYDGHLYSLRRGFKLRFEPVRRRIPIHLATLNEKALELTASHADGWMPTMIPLDRLGEEVEAMRQRIRAAGRDPDGFEFHAPGITTVATGAARERAIRAHAGTVAFYIGRMGVYYARQLERFGFEEEVATVRAAWENGSAAALEAVPESLRSRLATVGDIEECRERIATAAAAGATLHRVHVLADDETEFARTLERLLV